MLAISDCQLDVIESGQKVSMRMNEESLDQGGLLACCGGIILIILIDMEKLYLCRPHRFLGRDPKLYESREPTNSMCVLIHCSLILTV